MRAATLAICLAFVAGCGGDREANQKRAAPPPASPGKAEPAIAAVRLPADPGAPLPLDPKVKRSVLPNGLTYYIRKNAEPRGRAEFRLVVNAGSFQEEDDQRGLAHFIEHMAFNGTRSFPKNELISRLQKLGVRFGPHINAETSFDHTIYKLGVPTDKPESVALTLQILEEWAGQVTFLPGDVDAERGVVLAEKRDSLGAGTRITEAVIAKVFAGTRYANRIPIGIPQVLEKAPPDKLVRFYRDWYRPDNMAVVAVGDFDPAAIEKEIVARFGKLPRSERRRPTPDRTLPRRNELLFFGMQDKELPIAAVAVGRLVPHRPQRSMDDFRREFREVMTGLMLNRRLEEAKKKGEARYLMSGGGPTPLVRGADAFALFAAVKPEQMREGFEDLLAELERARRHGFTAGELKRVADELLSRLRNTAREDAAGKEESEGWADELARNYLTGEAAPGRPTELAIAEKFAREARPQEMTAVIAELMRSKDLVFAAVAPAGKPLLSREDATAELARLPQRQLVAYTDVKSNRPLVDRLPPPGKVVGEKSHPEVGVTEWTLSNGAHVYLKPTKFKADEILLRASSRGGTSLVPPTQLRKVLVASDLVALGGLGSFDSIELERLVAGRKVDVSPYIQPYDEGVVASSAVDDLEVMMQLVHLTFTAPRLDRKAFEVWRRSKLEEVRLARNQPMARFLLKLTPVETNRNPRVLVWTEKAVSDFDLDASFAFYRDRLQDAGDFRFVIVGAFDPAKIRPLVERYLGSLADLPRTESYALDTWKPHAKSKRVQVMDAADPRATLHFFFNRELPDRSVSPADRVAWSMFGEAVELELLDLFREQMGDTYSVQATTGFTDRRTRATLGVAFSCAPGRAATLERRALAEIRRMVTSGVGASSLDKARQAMLKALETDLESNSYWASELRTHLFDGESLGDIPARKKVIETLGAADVARAAQRFADPTRPVIGVLLPSRG